jgi:hypothetical protein
VPEAKQSVQQPIGRLQEHKLANGKPELADVQLQAFTLNLEDKVQVSVAEHYQAKDLLQRAGLKLPKQSPSQIPQLVPKLFLQKV